MAAGEQPLHEVFEVLLHRWQKPAVSQHGELPQHALRKSCRRRPWVGALCCPGAPGRAEPLQEASRRKPRGTLQPWGTCSPTAPRMPERSHPQHKAGQQQHLSSRRISSHTQAEQEPRAAVWVTDGSSVSEPLPGRCCPGAIRRQLRGLAHSTTACFGSSSTLLLTLLSTKAPRPQCLAAASTRQQNKL